MERLRKLVFISALCGVAMGAVLVVYKDLTTSSIQTAFPRQSIQKKEVQTEQPQEDVVPADFSQRAQRNPHLSAPVQIVNPAKPKNIDDYWKQTDLDLHYVDELLKEKYCHESEKRFLACVSALVQMAKELRLQILPNNQVISLTEQTYLDKSEKEILNSWRHFYRNKQSLIPGATSFSIQKSYSNLKKNIRKQDGPRITAVALNSFISVDLDPHSYLMPSSYYKEIIAKADPSSSNLGIVLREQNRSFYIRRVFEGSLAEKNGLKRNDELVEINGTSLKGLSKTSIQDLLRAEVGDVTRVKLKRNQSVLAFAIKRQATTLKTVSATLHTQNKKLGILTLNKFANNSCRLVEKSILSLKKSGATSILLDLRDNTGGQIDEASCIIGLFIGPKRDIFQLKYFEAEKGYDSYSTSRQRIFDGQLAVLINSNSASASEIVAGVLKELNRALIIGDRSFGKGSFQEGEGWGRGDDIIFFKTQGLFYFPSGQSPQGVGVTPDIQIATEANSNKSKTELLRENDLYWSSIANPKKSKSPVNRVTTAGKNSYTQCLSDHQQNKNQADVSVDMELETAQQVLGCLPSHKNNWVTGSAGAGMGR